MKITIDIEITDNIDNDPDIIGRIYYPDEGNKIVIVKGLKRAIVSDTICHEIGHLIDWYMTDGKQSDSVEIREKIADDIGNVMLNTIQ